MRGFYVLLMVILSVVRGFSQKYPVSTISDKLQNNAKAVIRLDQTDLTLLHYDRLQVSKKMVITIFKEDGDKFQVVPIHYDKHTKIKNYSGEIYDADGNLIKKIKRKDYNDYSAVPSGAMYSDDRVILVEYIPSQYPYTILLEYSYETSNTAFLPKWIPINAYDLGVENSQYKFVNKSDVKVQTKEVNFDQFDDIVKKEVENGFEYSINQAPPLIKEILSPPLAKRIPMLLLSPNKFQLAGNDGNFNTWKGFGKWMYNDLVRGRQELPKEEVNTISKLISDVTDKKDKVRILYQYMQDKTRYINVAIGIGGWQPYPAKYVSNKGYGDCKALTNYMMSLLKQANIPSNYTIVYGDQDSKIDIIPDFPSLQGNHVILQVPLGNDTIWLECTSQRTAFNHLGAFTSDRYALATNVDGGTIVKTQSFPAAKNKEIIVGKAKIDTKGHLDLTFESKTLGIQYDWNYRLDYLTRQEQLNSLQRKYDDIKSKKFLAFEFLNDKNNAEFIQNIHLTSEVYSQVAGKNLIFPILPVGRYTTYLNKDSTREQPIQINVGFTDESSFEIEIPANYKLSYNIEPIVFKSEFGEYNLMVTRKESALLIQRTFTLNEGIFPKEKYMEYVQFTKDIEKADRTKVLLEQL